MIKQILQRIKFKFFFSFLTLLMSLLLSCLCKTVTGDARKSFIFQLSSFLLFLNWSQILLLNSFSSPTALSKRINNDLLMWEPPPPSAHSPDHSRLHQDEFQLCKSAFRLGEFDCFDGKSSTTCGSIGATSLPKHLLLIKWFVCVVFG